MLNKEAIRAVLEALSEKAQEDMADKFSAPDEKVEEAMRDAEEGDDAGADDELENMDSDEDNPQKAAEEALEEEDEADPVKSGLKGFFKAKQEKTFAPGKQVVIAGVKMGKKSK